MALTHRLSLGCVAGSSGISKTISFTAGAEVNIDEALAEGADTLVALTLDVSQVKSFYMVSDQAIVVETNSSGAPVNVFTLAADKPFIWFEGNGTWRDTAGTAVSSDITALYVTNASGASATLQIRSLVDPTV